MKLVLDTNVILAGIFTRGVCEALLDICLGSEAHAVLISEAILKEFLDNAIEKFRVPGDEARRAVRFLREQTSVVVPVDVPKNACRDGDDLVILGTLLAADADCLVTGDKDLLVLKRFRGRPILTPRQCFDIISR